MIKHLSEVLEGSEWDSECQKAFWPAGESKWKVCPSGLQVAVTAQSGEHTDLLPLPSPGSLLLLLLQPWAFFPLGSSWQNTYLFPFSGQ